MTDNESSSAAPARIAISGKRIDLSEGRSVFVGKLADKEGLYLKLVNPANADDPETKFALHDDAAIALGALLQDAMMVSVGLAAMPVALAMILDERRRQLTEEGWTPEHDDEHDDHQLSQAAACYALGVPAAVGEDGTRVLLWPWDEAWWKPKDRIRDLVRAGALIVAEIERLQRAGGDA